MELSLAPMEGVTYSIYRVLHASLFPGADRCYAPFLAPDTEGRCKSSALRDILPENNAGLPLVPQLLVNAAGPFLSAARQLADLGYGEVDLNAGCPSGTVVAKHKGAGMLRDPAALDRLLEEIFSACPIRVSVKTRMGFDSTEEFPVLLEVYRKYPLSRLTVHARSKAGMYRSEADREGFAAALERCPFPVVYNGSISTAADYASLRDRFPSLSGCMIGRGAIANPALFREVRGGPPLRADELRAFHDELLSRYLASGLAPHYCAARMKELWFYMLALFPDAGRLGKAVFKSRTLGDYSAAVDALFSGCAFDPSIGFRQPT